MDKTERDRKEQEKEYREHISFFKGLLYGLFLGVLGNIWASFLIKILEFGDYGRRQWENWFVSLSLILFGVILLFLILYAKGYYFDYQREVNQYKSYWKKLVGYWQKFKELFKRKKRS